MYVMFGYELYTASSVGGRNDVVFCIILSYNTHTIIVTQCSMHACNRRISQQFMTHPFAGLPWLMYIYGQMVGMLVAS